jgi:hypothetical protein
MIRHIILSDIDNKTTRLNMGVSFNVQLFIVEEIEAEIGTNIQSVGIGDPCDPK